LGLKIFEFFEADSDPGSGMLLDPGTGMEKFVSRIHIPERQHCLQEQ
jgi:hypothetical protein